MNCGIRLGNSGPAKVRLAFLMSILFLGVFGAVLPGWAESISIVSARDNTLFQDIAGAVSNGAGPVFFVGRNSQENARRGLLFFDVQAALPAAATVDSVVLTLHLSDTTPRMVRVHRVTSDWGEGTSNSWGGGGASSTANDATWLHTFYPGVFWQAPGGDLIPNAADSAIVNQPDTYSWSGPGLAADVRLWLGGTGNYGWLLRGDEIATSTARRFDSREHVTPEFRPVLTVYYTLVPVQPVTWSSIKGKS
jgi:hypothetical protein